MWPRFVENCSYVHRFTCLHPHRYTLSRSSQLALGRVLNGTYLFPNLRVLALNDGSFSRIFMSPSIRHFYWNFESPLPAALSVIRGKIDDVVANMPDLSELSLFSGSLQGIYDETLADLCSRLRRLRSVHLTRHALTPIIFKSLMGLPALTSITINEDDGQDDVFFVGDRRHTLRWMGQSWVLPSPTVGAALDTLGISLPNVSIISSFLTQPTLSAGQLRSLDLVVGYPSTADRADTRNLFHLLSTACPSLSSLSIDMQPGFRQAIDIARIQYLVLDTFTPLFTLHGLTSFKIAHACPVEMTDSEAESFAKSLPRLRVLSLNRHPLVLYGSKLSVWSISSFARWCPEIEELSLFMDGRKIVRSLSSLHYARRLRSLNVGASFFPIEGTPDSWMFLMTSLLFMLPDNCNMDTAYHDSLFDSRVFLALADRRVYLPVPGGLLLRHHDGWCGVFSLLKSCQKIDIHDMQ